MAHRPAPGTLANVPGRLNSVVRRFSVTATAGAMVLAGVPAVARTGATR